MYPGSIGTFRYRFQRTGWMNDGTIQVWVYENISFELAQDVETETFPWTEEGVEAIRAWLTEKLEAGAASPIGSGAGTMCGTGRTRRQRHEKSAAGKAFAGRTRLGYLL